MTTPLDTPVDMKTRLDILLAVSKPPIYLMKYVYIYMYVYNHHCLMLNIYIYIYTYDDAPRHAPCHENAPRYITSPSLNPKHIQ